MELEKETMDLENKMVSVQGWSLKKYRLHFPMIHLANTIYKEKDIQKLEH